MKVSQQTRRKLTKQKFSMMYSHYEEHDDIDINEESLILGLGLTIIGAYWGIVHVIDKFTFNIMPWWVEPFTAFPLVGLLALIEIFGKNPLYWWPLFWGTKIQIKHIDDNPVKHTLHAEELIQKLGGPTNVYMVNWETLKFRRKKDVTKYILFTSWDRPGL